ncbi:MAG: histidine phosphatase family protein [Gemmataceae bacterium]|nr:histidine phosphatase family protein [Gemmataceae bacterium]MBJ7495818.1 histidine phosphatase family protein [Gemmataceae bacterium]
MKTNPTRVFLMRHAETSVPGVFHGAESDIGLSLRGIEQAKAAARFFQNLKPTKLISSGMVRALTTASEIASTCNLEIEVFTNLHERKVGTLSGTVNNLPDGPWRQTLSRWLNGETGFAPEGAESLDQMLARILPVWNEITSKYEGETVVIVAHGAVLKVLLLTILQEWCIADWDKFGVIPNVGITELVFNQHWESKRLNEIPQGAPEPAGFVLNG